MASGIGASDSLKAIFAISAPTNVQTDSFTQGGIGSTRLLNYINSLSNKSEFEQKDFVTEIMQLQWEQDFFTPTPLESYDTKILQTDFDEWNLISSDYANIESPFWTKRGIHDRLVEINIPTYHIAGMVKDQDGRDSLNNFLIVDKYSPYRKKHRLYIGDWGHNGMMAEYMHGRVVSLLAHHLRDLPSNYISESRVHLASHRAGKKYYQGHTYPFLEVQTNNLYHFGVWEENALLFANPNSEEDYTEYHSNRIDASDTGYQKYYQQYVDRDMFILGSFDFDLYVSLDTYQADLNIRVFTYDAQTNKMNDLFPNSVIRKRIVNKGGAQVLNVKIKSAPIYKKLKKGIFLVYQVYSNLYAGMSIVNHNSDPENYDGNLKQANIKILHSSDYKSTLTINTENIVAEISDTTPSNRSYLKFTDRLRHKLNKKCKSVEKNMKLFHNNFMNLKHFNKKLKRLKKMRSLLRFSKQLQKNGDSI